MTNSLFPVILCGGAGSRLWPLSRTLYPKQFMDLGGHTLFGDTLARLAAIGAQTPLVISNAEQRFLAAMQMQQHGHDATGRIVLEPVGRNTAPAIAIAALTLLERVGDAATMLVLPSDHVIADNKAFGAAVAEAQQCAADGHLVTFGIVPDRPETGYGYIQQGEALAHGHAVARFVEKPALENAKDMLAEGGYFWNSGMFVFICTAFLEALSTYAPAMLAAVRKAFAARREERDFVWLGADFADCPADSIDYAVLEKTNRAAMVPLAAGWNDLGSWSAVHGTAPHDAQGNACVGDVLLQNVQDSYVHSTGRLVAALNVRDLVVVETGDAVLVAPRESAQDVKKIVETLSAQGRKEHNSHLRVYRPWGWYETLALGERFQVKRIQVNAGASLSLQLHHKRAEHWVVVEGTATVTLGEEDRILLPNQSTYIPVGVKHRLANHTDAPLLLIEIQSGSYLGEDDIERFDDHYGRA